MERLELRITVDLNGKIVINRPFYSNIPKNALDIYMILNELIFHLRAVLKYAAFKCGFNHNPKIGNLVITVTCGNSAITVLEIQGVISGTDKEINNMLSGDKVLFKLLEIIINHLLLHRNSK